MLQLDAFSYCKASNTYCNGLDGRLPEEGMQIYVK